MALAQLQPLPRAQSDPETQTQMRENRIVDIAEYFSKEALNTLEQAGAVAFAAESGEVLPKHLFTVLQKKNKFNESIKGKGLSIKSSNKEKGLKTKGLVYFSPELKKVLFTACFLSRQEEGNEVFDKHLLMAFSLMPEYEGVLSGETLDKAGKTKAYSLPDTLRKYAKDLTAISSTSVQSFFGRESEIEQSLRILTRENKHHLMLLGEGGVGKSALGEGLAAVLNAKEVPSLSSSQVLSLDLGSLFSTPATVSQFGPKIIEEIAVLPRVIIFLEQAVLLNSPQQISMLINFLQNLEKQTQINFILPATPAYYNQNLANNPYFASFFEILKIEEMAADLSVKILTVQGARMEKYHKVTIDQEVYPETVMLAKRYLGGNMPQKAISLLEEVCASTALAGEKKVTVENVKKIVGQKTGIPISSLTVSEKEKLTNLEGVLAETVIGQKEAIKKVAESLRRARAGLKDPKKPIGSFLFLGPTGVGKTELAKTLARVFFDDEKAFLRLDMSEYSESHTAQRLIGSPPGYVGYEEGGQLTNPVSERPYCLILFDEIEKAHQRIFDLFLQVLDDGRLTDARGNVVDFKNTLLIFTSNIAAEEIFSRGKDLVTPGFNRKAFFEKSIMPIVREYFRPEFINRFDDIVLFNPLTKKELVEIAKLKLKQLNERLKDKKIQVEVAEGKIEQLVALSYNPSFGARPLERAIREQIENVIANKIISGEVKKGQSIRW